jgi:hypothetical protein
LTLRFAYSLDGGVSIITAAPKADIEVVLGPLTNEQYRIHVLERSVPTGATDLTELPRNWTPPDRSTRHAWVLRNGKVEVDRTKL